MSSSQRGFLEGFARGLASGGLGEMRPEGVVPVIFCGQKAKGGYGEMPTGPTRFWVQRRYLRQVKGEIHIQGRCARSAVSTSAGRVFCRRSR